MYQAIRRLVRSSPLCHQVLRLFLERYRRLGVHRDTELVIEGYPRSANSFAALAIIESQHRPVAAAHHLHALSQIKLGVRRGLPVLVLIREPKAAALSLTIRAELPSVVWALEEYLDFYRGVEQLLERVVVVDYEEVVTDMGAATRRLNARFGTCFDEFRHTDENVAKIYNRLEEIEQRDAGGGEVRETHVARPSAARQRIKDALADQFEHSPARDLYAEASALYWRILARSGAVALQESS